MANFITEEEIEQMALQTLQEQEYDILNGANIERQYNEVVLTNRLQAAVKSYIKFVLMYHIFCS